MKLGTHRLVTESFIAWGSTKGCGWTSRQFEILGESWPPKKGWKERACERMISNEEWDEFIQIGRDGRSGKTAPPPVERKPRFDFGIQTVTFGKHKGLLWKDVPREYLEWIVLNFEDKESFACKAARAVLKQSRGNKKRKKAKFGKKKHNRHNAKIAEPHPYGVTLEYYPPPPGGYPARHPIPEWAVIGPPDEVPPWENLPTPTSPTHSQ